MRRRTFVGLGAAAAGAGFAAASGVGLGRHLEGTTAQSREELDGFVTKGIANRKLFDFEPVSFSQELAPATKLQLPEVKTGSLGLYSRGTRTYFVWVEKGQKSVQAKVKAGTLKFSARFRA
mgnify:CR=1 FL=1